MPFLTSREIPADGAALADLIEHELANVTRTVQRWTAGGDVTADELAEALAAIDVARHVVEFIEHQHGQ